MKKATALCVVLVLIAAAFTSASVFADSDHLSLTVNGESACTYRVGDEIAFYLHVDVGETVIINGDVSISYDSSRLEVVEHTAVVDDDESMEAYSFPKKIYKSNHVLNTEVPGVIKMNFSRSKGIGTLTGDHTLLARFHFRVKQGGAADIRYQIVTMCDKNEQYIYYKGVANEDYHPVASAQTMIASVIIGDVDGDGKVSKHDAVILNRYIARREGYESLIAVPEAADLNEDGEITLRDAILLDRYVAGWEGYDRYISELNR